MKLRVTYTAQLRTALERTEDFVELPEASSLSELLVHLAEQNQAARLHLLTAAGQVNPCLLLVVNEAAIAASDATSIVLKDGDAVLLLPPIAGG
jgi:molybdopterin converting factor small subunit